MLEKIQTRFKESIQLQMETSELLPPVLSQAATKIVDCLLRGNKIIVCGHARSYINAQLLTTHLLHKYELARPSFAAIQLQFDSVLAGVVAGDNELANIYRKQLQAVAKAGDLFIAFSPLGDEDGVLNAIHYAKNEGLEVIALTSRGNDHTQGLLEEQDLEIVIPSNNELRIIEAHLFCVNLLCEFTDHLLFS